MAKFSFSSQPMLRVLKDEDILTIHEKALVLLENTGVYFHSQSALDMLEKNGANVDRATRTARFPRQMVLRAVERAPESFDLYGSDGRAVHIGGDEVHFDPGSATVRMLLADGSTRPTVGADLETIAKLADGLDNIDLLSTAISPSDLPAMIADSYRVMVLLKTTRKPILAGAFSSKGMKAIYELLCAACGSPEALKQKPRAVIDVCCTAPLKWTEIGCDNLMDGAEYGLPIELLSVPIIGAAAPATLAGCVLLHTVESLSGIVLTQSVNPGNKLVYGGAPMYFDMRHSTTSLNSVEANLISAAYSQMGKFYGLPTHTYSCLSDSKAVDAQAGLESAISGVVAQLAGVNIVSGPGSTEFCNSFSLEKLVIDNDICGMAKRLSQGINCDEEHLAQDLIAEIGHSGEYLSTEHTLEWYKKEPFLPSKAIDRSMLHTWKANGSKDALRSASDVVREKLAQYKAPELEEGALERIDNAWARISEKCEV